MARRLPPKRALVTGATGFVGRRLVQALRRDGWQVRAISVRGTDDADAVWVRLRRARPEVVFHLGGPTADAPATPMEAMAATRLVLDLCARWTPAPRVVVVSSSAVYGVGTRGVALTEDAPLHPCSHYAVSKVGVEALAHRASHVDHLPVIIARPFNIIGPEQLPGRVPAAFAAKLSAVVRGEATSIHVRNLDASRDLVDVRDVANALVLLGERGRPGMTYNIASGTATSLRSVFQWLTGRSGVVAPVVETPDGEVAHQRGSATRLRRLGWRPAITLHGTLEELARAHGLIRTRPHARHGRSPRPGRS